MNGPITWWKNRSAAKRAAADLAAMQARWFAAIAAAVGGGAEREQNRDPRNGALLTALHDVAPEHRAELEALGFRRLHAECETWIHQGPPTKGVARPDVALPGRPARMARGRPPGA